MSYQNRITGKPHCKQPTCLSMVNEENVVYIHHGILFSGNEK